MEVRRRLHSRLHQVHQPRSAIISYPETALQHGNRGLLCTDNGFYRIGKKLVVIVIHAAGSHTRPVDGRYNLAGIFRFGRTFFEKIDDRMHL